jgi:hypothetical protein
MLVNNRKALVVSLLLALWLQFGLQTTAVFFYELHHATGIGWIYWGYSIFKGGGYYFGVWPYQALVSIGLGLGLFLILSWRSKRRQAATGV